MAGVGAALRGLESADNLATSLTRAAENGSTSLDDLSRVSKGANNPVSSLSAITGVSETTIKTGIQAGTIPSPNLLADSPDDWSKSIGASIQSGDLPKQIGKAADTVQGVRGNPVNEADHLGGRSSDGRQLGGPEDTTPGSKSAREGYVIEKIGDNSWSASTKVAIAGGIAVCAWVAYLGSLANENNRAVFKIDKIKIERKGSSTADKLIRKVTFTFNIKDVTYRDPPTRKVSPDYVKVCVNDYLQCKLGSGGGKKYLNGSLADKFLIKNVSGTDVTFEVPNSSIASFFVNFPACSATSSPSLLDGYCDASVRDGTVYTADVSSGSNYFILYTSFANQFAQNLVDNIQGLANIFERVITTLASAGGNAAKNVVCETVPLVCNWLTWVILVVVIVIGIILFTTIK